MEGVCAARSSAAREDQFLRLLTVERFEITHADCGEAGVKIKAIIRKGAQLRMLVDIRAVVH